MSESRTDLPQIGIIGISGYAEIYVDWLLQAQQANRVAISAFVAIGGDEGTENARKLSAAGAKRFASYTDMLEATHGHMDLCLIPTGIHWHARMSIAALKAGCNVLCEKPLAGSIRDGLAIIDTVKQTGRWLALGFQDMYTEETAHIKKEIVQGRIGKVESISMLGIWPRMRSYYSRNSWAGRHQIDGEFALDSPINNALSHFINLSLFLAGEQVEDSTEAFLNNTQLYRAHSIDSFDTAIVQATSERGTRFWFGVSHAHAKTIDPIIRIVGSKGTIEWRQEERCLIRSDSQEEEIVRLTDSYAARDLMLDTVLEKLTDPKKRICGPEIGLCHTRLIESIYRIGTIRNFDPSVIDETPMANENSTVPSVCGLEDKMITAFETLSSLNDQELIAQTTEVSN